ncbi:putative membrane protein [Synechococcus sp. BIOS-U3-1]|nr:putative membrane protein [Synechococcus sp. BIOS-U3-1]
MNLYFFIRIIALLLPSLLSLFAFFEVQTHFSSVLVLLASSRFIGGVSLLNLPFSITRSRIFFPKPINVFPHILLLVFLSYFFKYRNLDIGLIDTITFSAFFLISEYTCHALACTGRQRLLTLLHGNPILYIGLLVYGIFLRSDTTLKPYFFAIPAIALCCLALWKLKSDRIAKSKFYHFRSFSLISSFLNILPRFGSFICFSLLGTVAPSLVAAWSLSLVVQMSLRLEYIIYLPKYLHFISQGSTAKSALNNNTHLTKFRSSLVFLPPIGVIAFCFFLQFSLIESMLISILALPISYLSLRYSSIELVLETHFPYFSLLAKSAFFATSFFSLLILSLFGQNMMSLSSFCLINMSCLALYLMLNACAQHILRNIYD